MGCTQFGKKKPTEEGDEVVANGDANGEVKNAKKGKNKTDKSKDNKKDKKNKKSQNGANGEEANGEVKNGSIKTGPNSAKVRPLTPTPAALSQNVPKPVAFDVDLESQQNGISASAANGSVGDGGIRLRLPRKLPKLTSLTNRTASISGDQPPLTTEEIMEKQRKAEENRQEVLEVKKQKARKFVEKFGNNGSSSNSKSISISVTSSQEEEDDIGDHGLMAGMNGLDSGLGLDGYGLDGDIKIDEKGMTNLDDDELLDKDYRNQMNTAASAPVVVQDGADNKI